MKKNLIFFLIIIAIVIITIISVQTISKNRLVHSGGKITVGLQKNSLSALLVVAQTNGYFKKLKTNVILKPYPSGKLALQGMFNKEVDVAVASDVSIAVESFYRKDFSIIATVADSNNQAWIIARKDVGINNIEDLKGKRIGTQKESGVHFFLSMFLLHNKISEDQVSILYYPPNDLPKALINGEIDAFSMRNPFIQQAKNALTDNYVEFIDNAVYLQKFILVGISSFIDNNSKEISNLISALIKADTFIQNNKDEAKKILANYLGLIPDEIQNDWDHTLCSINISRDLILILEAQASWLKRNRHIIAQTPNYLDFIYKSPELMKHPDKYRIIK
ncbi:MAG: hypothetical protein A2Y40_10285 [Candidatus Margulisbacteria bacterium GWF2_35_9]|nr:MAG: hypothetical protein A2Y40_10285 [Candidatus Margulisbacteria bacterium GWF2_35_9]